MTPSTQDSGSDLVNSRALVRARRQAADSWIGDDVDFAVQRRGARGSRTIMLEPARPLEADPEADHPRARRLVRGADTVAAVLARAARFSGRGVRQGVVGLLTALRIMSRDPKELATATALELDRAGAIVGGKAKEVGEEVAAVAQAGAERVNHVRRAGLPPARERHLERPRVSPPPPERRPRRKLADRVSTHPDRIVLWAVALGAFLIVIAATSSSHP